MKLKINTIEKVNVIQSWFIEMINKISKPLAAIEGKTETEREIEERFSIIYYESIPVIYIKDEHITTKWNLS